MMKKISKILLIVFSTFLLIPDIYAETTLKDLKENVEKAERKLSESEADKKKKQAEIKKLEGEISGLNVKIEKNQKAIDESKLEIERLDAEIVLKEEEIKNLLSFNQISDGDNVYLEYVFGASSFTDFIYRSAVVEQLSLYNDGLVDEMHALIEENKQLQEKLKKQISDFEDSIDNLNKLLKKANLSMDDLNEDHKDAKGELQAAKDEYNEYKKQYEAKGCSEEQTISECLDIPYATGFTRPLVKASVTSNYGMRFHPTKKKWLMHTGLDLGVATGTKVYSSASGKVTRIVKVANPNKKNSSCGGNAVYVRHNVEGKEYTTGYLHLHTIEVKLGQYVTLNTVVGTSGGGESYDYCTTGPHLHFSIQKGSSYVNPRNYISFPSKGGRFSSRFY